MIRQVLIIIIIIISYLSIVNKKAHALHTDMISDILKLNSKSHSLITFLCDDKTDLVKIIKAFSKNYISVNVKKVSNDSLNFPFPLHHSVFLVDLKCKKSWNLLFYADFLRLFSSPQKWLLISSQSITLDTFKKACAPLNIPLDSSVLLASFKARNYYSIHEIYKRRRNLSLAASEIGIWKNGSLFVYDDFRLNGIKSRSNLMKETLKTCLVITHNDSLNHLTDRRYAHIDTITKVNYNLIQHISDVVNATLNYSIQNTWGYKNELSQWSGMIGELQREEADVGGTPLFMTTDRLSIVDYIAMTTPTRSKFVFREPRLSYVTNVYVLPFHWSVWLSLVGLLIATSISLYIVIKWEWYKKTLINIVNTSNVAEVEASYAEIIFVVFGTMCQQGSSSVPLGHPARIITILTLITLMFLYTSYSATIVALLQSSSQSIQSLEDLLNSPMDVGVDDTVFNHFYFPKATEPVRRALYLKKVAPSGQRPKFCNLKEGVGRLRNENFAFHMEVGVGYKFVLETFEEHEKCDLREIQFLQVTDPWIAIQKNSPYKEILKIGFLKLQESGLQSREYFMLYTKKPSCASNRSNFVSVGIIDCYLAAVVLLGGIILSIIVLCVELTFSSNKTKCRYSIC